MLTAAGLTFDVVPSSVDEALIKTQIAAEGGFPQPLGLARAVAMRLAEAKAADVHARHPDAIVIGADQTLALIVPGPDGSGGRSFDKPAGRRDARDQLVEMRGRTHVLCAAVAVLAPEQPAWCAVDEARLTMRAFTDGFLDEYLDRAGEKVCTSVGAYQLEGLGIQLFEAIEGDYFTILGLPLLPLLAELRRNGFLSA